MRKIKIGYIFCNRKPEADEHAFLKVAERKNVELVMFNICKKITEKDLRKKARSCKIIYNNSAEDFAYEIVKTLERFGKRVIEPSTISYSIEDKWTFYLECEKYKIPSPKTILLSEDLNLIRKELKEFNQWPVILKRVYGTNGNFVEKANNIDQAIQIVEKFWKKSIERYPIIAQEFIKSSSYRVLMIDGEIIQTAIKESKGWKCTGVYQKKCRKFPIDKKLEKILKKLVKFVKIKVCGIDLLKKNGKWIVLEVNAQPSFDFFDDEREMVIEKVMDLLIKEIKV